MADVEAILREAGSLRTMRELHERDWRNIAQTMVPSVSDLGTLRQPGSRRTERVYDPTGMHGVIRLSSFLQSMMINFSSRWFSLKMRLLDNNQEANAWLEKVANIMTATYSNNTSPISQTVYEMFIQYIAFGTGGLFIDEAPMTFLDEPETGFRGYFATSMSVGTYDLGESPLGMPDTVYRHFQATPHQLEQQFGALRLSEKMKRALASGQEAQRHVPVDILHATMPRRDRDRSLSDMRNMPYASVYIDVVDKHEISEGGFRFFPYMTPRWSKIIPHTPWGFGPGHLALPDVLSLNVIDQDILRALPMSIFPPGWLQGADQELVGKVSLVPGTVMPMPSGGGFVPYQSGLRLDAEQLQVAQRQLRVRSTFFLDLLETLPDINDPVTMTATEVIRRQQLMAQIMGPALRRWLAEFLNPFIDVTFSIGLIAGLFPPPPNIVLDVAAQFGGQVDVEYEGLLSQASRLDTVQPIDDSLTLGASLSEQLGDPLILRNIDVDQAFQDRMRAGGMPAHLIRDIDDVRAERAEMARRQEEQLRAQGLREDAAAAGAAAPALTAVNQAAGV